MTKWATTLLLAILIGACVIAAPASAQFTRGGNDETTEDMSNTVAGTAWNAAAGTAATPGTVAAGVTGTHLLITEVGWRGLNNTTTANPAADSSEFVEIYNPTSCTIDLSGVYLSDVNAYSTLPVAGTIDVANNATDFAMKFPTGSLIAPGQVVVVAIDGGRFQRATGTDANYMMFNAGGTTTALPMVDVASNKPVTYPTFGMFTNGGEFVWLFHWDAQSDLVTDLDFVYWGAPTGANIPSRKLATSCQDGPDGDALSSCYFADAGNPAGSLAKALTAPASGAGTRQRTGAESEAVTTGGNGALPSPATVSLVSDLNPATCGAKINLTATVSGSSTGSVTFYDGATSLGTAPLAAGMATLSITLASIGAHSLTVDYAGDACNGAAVSPALIETVDPAPSSVVLTTDFNPSACGQKVTLSATVSPFDGSGTVTFLDGGSPIGSAAVVGGIAQLSVTDLTAGFHSLVASFSGGGCSAASLSPEYIQEVQPGPSNVSVTSDVNPSVCGGKVNFTATVTPPGVTGTVTFFIGPDPLGLVTLDASGQATFSAQSELYTGSLVVTAQYSGDACHAPATSPDYVQVVTPATPVITLVSESNPSECGTAVGFNATIVPAFVVGDLQLYDGATLVGTSSVDAFGNAHFVLTFTGPGTHTLTVQFAGDFCTAPGSSAPLEQVVNQAAVTVLLTSDANPSICGQRVIFTANVPAGATGTVTFFDGATPLETVAVDALGTARHSTSSLLAGSHTITAVYSGDACYSGATSAPVVQVVDLDVTETTLTSDINPSTCGAKVTLTATVTAPNGGGNGIVAKGRPQTQGAEAVSGSVTFYDGATALGTSALDANGVATLSVTSLLAGSHTLTANYTGNACTAASTSPAITQTVTPNASSVVVTSDPNPSVCDQPVVFTATVTPAGATGTVTFYDGGNPIGTSPVDATGHASLTIAFPGQPPVHTITAQYSGDGCTTGSTSPDYAQRVDQIATTVAVSSDATPVKFGAKVNLTATVSPAASTGVVVFYDGATFLAQATLAGGTATISLTTLTTGSHDITATYSGDDCYAPSTSPIFVQVVVPDNPPAVTVISPNGHENLVVGTTWNMKWLATDDNAVQSVSLSISRDYGSTYQTIATDIPNSGSFNWLVTPPGTNTTATLVYSALLKVVAKDNAGQSTEDVSDDFWSIFDFTVAVVVTRLDASPADAGIAIRWAMQNAGLLNAVVVERAESETGPWNAIHADARDEGGDMVAVDTDVAAAKTYWYRLVGQTTAGSRAVFGPVKGTAAAPRSFALSRVWPNPSSGSMRTEFAVPRASNIRLSVLDLQGREVQVLAQGAYAAGRYQVNWDGRTASGSVPGGIYFIRYITPDTKLTQRVVIAR